MLIEEAISAIRNKPDKLFTHEAWTTHEVFTAFQIRGSEVFKLAVYNKPDGKRKILNCYKDNLSSFLPISSEEIARDGWIVVEHPEYQKTEHWYLEGFGLTDSYQLALWSESFWEWLTQEQWWLKVGVLCFR